VAAARKIGNLSRLQKKKNTHGAGGRTAMTHGLIWETPPSVRQVNVGRRHHHLQLRRPRGRETSKLRLARARSSARIRPLVATVEIGADARLPGALGDPRFVETDALALAGAEVINEGSGTKAEGKGAGGKR